MMYFLFGVHKKNAYVGEIVQTAHRWMGKHDKANAVVTFHSYFANTLKNSVATME
jgi:hypothetical protein